MKRIILGTLIFSAAFFAYFNTLKNGFVWDDHVLIDGNSFIAHPSNAKILIEQLALKPVVPILGAARPIFLLSLMADHAFCGTNAFGWHLTNLLIHSANSVLVWQFAELFLSPPSAVISGFLFAVHPINTEAVNLPSFRPDLLAAFFVLLALWAYVYFGKTLVAQKKIIFLAASTTAYFLGLLSKEMAATLPALALWWDFSFSNFLKSRINWAWRIVALGLYFLLAVYYLAFRAPRSGYQAINAGYSTVLSWPENLLVQKHNADLLGKTIQENSHKVFKPSTPQWDWLYHDPALNFKTMTVVIADYFRLFIFPYPLHADRAPPIIQSWKDWRFILSCAWLSFLLLVLAFAYRNKKRALTWSLGYCFIALLPVSNIIPIYNPMAERYLYMVSIGACWAMAYLLWAIIMRIRYYLTQKGFEKLSVQLIPLALVLIIFAGYGAKTVIRNRDWKSDKTLFLKEAAAGSSNARVYYNLAYIFQSGDDLKQAAHFYRKALSLNPHFIEASNNLAGIDDALGNSVEALTLYNNPAMSKSRNPKVYENWGRILEKTSPEKAASAYRQALKISPKDSFARLRLAFCLIQEKKIPEALSEIKQIEKDDPSYANAYLELGKIDDEMGRYEDAIKQFKKFVERDPGSDEGLMNLGVAYHHVGNFDQAVFWLKKSIALNSSNAAAYYNFGVVKSDQGNLNEAVQVLKKALQIDSKYEDAAYNLGVIEQKMGNIPAAMSYYKRALKINPKRLEALNNLGGLEEAAGNLKVAEKYFTKALKIDPYRPSLLNNTGNIYLKEGKISKAIAQYQEALIQSSAYGDPPANLAPTLTNLGLCYYQKGRTNDAIAEWRLAIQDLPSYIPAYQALKDALEEAGQPEEADRIQAQIQKLTGR